MMKFEKTLAIPSKENLLINMMKFEKTLAITSRENLIVNLYTTKKYLKAKKINTNEGFQCFYTQVILIDSVYRKDKNYSPQVFLGKCNFIVIEKKICNFNDDIEIYSNKEICSYNEDSYEKYSDDSHDSDE